MASDTTRILTAALIACACAACGDNLTRPPALDSYEGSAPAPLECVPNLDGRLDADELQEALGVPVSYVVSPQGATRSVDLAGQVNASGERRWDWSQAASGDQLARIEAAPLGPQWFAPSFPGGAFVAPSDPAGRLVNVFSRDADGLYLHGIASAQESPAEGQTLIEYDDPVALYLFPLTPGKTWVSVGQARDSTVLGLPYAGTDTYEIEVEARGQLVLPELTFDDAYQVHTRVVIAPAVGQSVRTRQVSFLFECFGEVARATSQNDEDEKFFTSASETRRLGVGY